MAGGLTSAMPFWKDADVSKGPSDGQSPLAKGMEWAYRIFAVVAVMVGPGLGGQWLDDRFGTHFLALLGFAIGLTLGISCLIVMTRSRSDPPPPPRRGD